MSNQPISDRLKNLDVPEIRAALDANRAKLAMMAQKAAQPNAHQVEPTSSTSSSTYSRARKGNAYADTASSPSKIMNGEYTPRFTDSIRASASSLAADATLPSVGDLFSHSPALPAGLQALHTAVPPPPVWSSLRPYLSGSFILDTSNAPSTIGLELGAYPPAVQEALLVDDLLSAFLGTTGTLIKPKLIGGRMVFGMEYQGRLEPALHEMAIRMLPLCEYVVTLQRYVETRCSRYEWGRVCHALAAALRSVLYDWDLMVAQLESQLKAGKLTLQGLWYYVQPPMSALRFAATLAAEASVNKLRGASLLDMLASRCASSAGDAHINRLAHRLLRAASEPYFQSLEKWLCEGVVDDPWMEFMIIEDASITVDSLTRDGQSGFWYQKYTIRPCNDPAAGKAYEVPLFLSKAKDHILATGKYVNIIRACGRQPERPLPLGAKLDYDEGGRFLLLVTQAHKAASAAALDLLRREAGLLPGLAALKKYFLLSQGDVLSHLMDAGDADWGRMVGSVPLLQLQGALDMAVRASSASKDPAALKLKAALDHRSLLNMLIAITQNSLPTGGEAGAQRLRPVTPAPMTSGEKSTIGKQRSARESFMLSYQVPWPLSIVAPDAVLAQYQMIFRHLFELKWVERELVRMSGLIATTDDLAVAHRRAQRKGTKSELSGVGAQTLARAYSLCQLANNFFRQYLLYLTFEVLEPLWREFENSIKEADSLDEILEHHSLFLHKILKGCLLSRKVVVLRALLGLKDLALQFVKLADKHLSLNFAALDEEAEADLNFMGRPLWGAEAQRARRAGRAAKMRAALAKTLENPGFAGPIAELRKRFLNRVGDFVAALAEAHKQAQAEKTDTREELEGLLNLIARLDFNGFLGARLTESGGAAGDAVTWAANQVLADGDGHQTARF